MAGIPNIIEYKNIGSLKCGETCTCTLDASAPTEVKIVVISHSFGKLREFLNKKKCWIVNEIMFKIKYKPDW